MHARPTSWLLVLTVVLLSGLLIGPGAPGVYSEPVEEKTWSTVRLVEPARNGSVQLWPYTSRGRRFARATLPINLVVHAEASTVRQVLVFSSDDPARSLYWNATAQAWDGGEPQGEGEVVINGTGVRWGSSDGAARYTYVRKAGSGKWMDATYQLHDGNYFGSRYHLRLYESGTDDQTWTAIQAHHEYWDWFRLRHEVDSLAKARHHVERDFMGTGLMRDISRERYGNGGALDADGWVTVIDLRPVVTRGPKPLDLGHWSRGASGAGLLVLVLGSSSVRNALLGVTARVRTLSEWVRSVPKLVRSVPKLVRSVPKLVRSVPELVGREVRALWRDLAGLGIDRHHVGLFASTALLPLVVRVGAITAERAFPVASTVTVGGPFYVLLVVGLPAVAVLFGRWLPVVDGFATAVLGLGTGLMADYTHLGIVSLPYGAVVQRIVLLFGLGLVAAGGHRAVETPLAGYPYRLAGLAIWAGALLYPLLGLG